MAHNTPSPHDTYFQSMMERSEVAESFFKAHLHAEAKAGLNWNSLKIADSVRRLPNKKPSYTDITYVCNTKEGDVPIYLHVEQERNVDPYIVERILKYKLGLFIKHRKQKQEKLPIIATFVLYNGNKRKNYPYHEDMYDYFGVPWMAKLLMGNFFWLINLNKESDSTLVEHSYSGIMELLLKRADSSNFIEWLKEEGVAMGRAIKEGKGVDFKDIIEASTEYALAVGKGKAEDIIEAFSVVYPDFKDTIMTAAKQLEKRGMQQGKLAIAQNMLKDREAIEKIKKWTGLSKEAIEALKNK
jgi:predicted transposase/invertase (TIGR01784 family)